MKKKFSIWLHIATICLCVCAIAIGVYAAQSATLTVSGTVGFTAHGIKYSVTAEAKGYVTNVDDVTTYKSDFTELTNKVTDATKSQTLSLGNLNFTDLQGDTVPNIEIKFTITNNSKFDILVAPNTATCTNVTPTSTDGGIATKNGGTTTITYTLSLDKDSTGAYKALTGTDNLSIKINLTKFIAKTDTSGNAIEVSKYTVPEQTTIYEKTAEYSNKNYSTTYTKGTDKSYAEEFPYYITMGTKSSTAIKWLIVGYNNNGTVAALTKEDKAALAGGRLLASKDYIALSAEALEGRVFNKSTNSHEGGINANDYSLSDIRTYLRNTESAGFASTYSLTNPSIAIKPRTASELYADIDAKDSMSSSSADGRIKAQNAVTGEDNFWLLSQAEVYTIFNVDTSKAPYYSASITTELGSTDNSPVWWWLRSPNSIISNYARVVYDYGYVSYSNGVHNTGAVRAAFQF